MNIIHSFVSMFSRQAPQEDIHAKNILDEISLIKTKMEILDSCFNLAEDEDVVEACIFEQKALATRYSHLLKLAKNMNLKTQLLRDGNNMERSFTG